MRLEVTRIAQDGDIRRRILDTTGRMDAGRWENLAAENGSGPEPGVAGTVTGPWVSPSCNRRTACRNSTSLAAAGVMAAARRSSSGCAGPAASHSR